MIGISACSTCGAGSTRATSTPSWWPSPICRVGCRASGCTASYFAEHVLDHGTEGCNYLLAVDVDMNTVDGYAMSSWDQGYGDMEFVLDPQTIRMLPHQPGAAMVQCDLVWLDHTPVRQSPRTILNDPASGRGGSGLRRPGRHRTGIHRLQHQLRGGLELPLSRSGPGQPVQRRLLDPGRQPGRAPAAGDPQHHVRGRDGRRVGQGRVQLRPARDRIPLRRRADHRGQPRGLQDRRQGDRCPARKVDHLHGQVQRARGQLLPHPSIAAR